MSIYSSLVSEVKKGCGEHFFNFTGEIINILEHPYPVQEYIKCGDNNKLCKECKVSLDILAKFKDMAEKEIDKLDLSLLCHDEIDKKYASDCMYELKQKLLGEGE